MDYNGILEYQTVFGHGTHYIGESSEKNDAEHSITPIDGFLVNEWNHVVLFPVGLEIHMKINENYIGKIADIQEGISGRASIGGYIGAMFDNLNVISSSAN